MLLQKHQLKTLSDEDLISRILLNQHKDECYSLLYDRYANKIFRKAILITKSKEVAEDLSHDIFIKAMLKLSTFKGGSSFSTWLFSITYNHCIDYVKKESRNGLSFNDSIYDRADDGDNEVFIKELEEIRLERLEEIFKNLSSKYSIVLLMFYKDAYSINDIAKKLGESEGTVKMRLKRARDKVRSIYNEKYTTDERS